MKITKIIKLKNDQYKLEFSNKNNIKTYDEIILKYNLLYKKELDEETYHSIVNDTLDYNVYRKVLKYALIKYRSIKEIREYMKKLEIDDKNQEIIIDKLKQNNALNEERFVETFISDQMHLTKFGPSKIRTELLKHNIDLNVIDKYLEKYDDSVICDKLNKLIVKKVKTLKNSKAIMKQKLTIYFLNLGYDSEMIKRGLSNIEFNSSDNIKKDYEKIKNKLISKYNESELEYQIKAKLYQKGYSNDEISTIKEA